MSGGGRHRADTITNDLTVANLARYRAHVAITRRTMYTGHLGTPGRHDAKVS